MATPPLAPAATILGRGLYGPRLGAAPFDAVQTLEASGRQIINLSDNMTQWTVPNTNVVYDVPKNILHTWNDSSSALYRTFETSSEAITDIEASASLEASYMGFKGGASTKMALRDAFASSSYIAMFAYAYNRYSMNFDNQETFPRLFNKAFVAELQTLPQPFDGGNPDNFKAYSEFLYRWGTHMVTEVSFGQRFLFDISQTTTDNSTFADFEASVSAEYDGFPSIKGDAGFKTTQAYKTYAKDSLQAVTLAGGSQKWHAKLAADPADKDTFEKWSGEEDAVAEDKPQHLLIESVANILRLTPQSDLSKYAADVELAADFISSVRETKASGSQMKGSRPMLFVKVRDQAKAPGQVSLILSNDGDVAVSKFNSDDGWNPPPGLQDIGFEYGAHGRSISFQGYPYKTTDDGYGWDAGNITRFSLQYGPTTTVTLVADDNVEYVVFASGKGHFHYGGGPDEWWYSRHVYWVPSTDANPLILNDVDLGQGAAFTSSSYPGPRGQFARWQKLYGMPQ